MALFRCNLPSPTIRGMRFETNEFRTDDPEQIEFLRGHGMQSGILVEEVEEEPSAPPPPAYDLAEILAAIEACADDAALDAIVEEMQEKYPDDMIVEADRETIIAALNEKTEGFKDASGLSAKQEAALIAKCTTVEGVEKLMQGDPRQIVQRAGARKIKELTGE